MFDRHQILAQRLHVPAEYRAGHVFSVHLKFRLADLKEQVRLAFRLAQEDGLNADQALTQFCLMTLNLNEFAYLDS